MTMFTIMELALSKSILLAYKSKMGLTTLTIELSRNDLERLINEIKIIRKILKRFM